MKDYLILIAVTMTAIVVTFFAGILAGVEAEQRRQSKLISAYAYGLDEKDNVWNRIRVDQNGHVICSKGE